MSTISDQVVEQYKRCGMAVMPDNAVVRSAVANQISNGEYTTYYDHVLHKLVILRKETIRQLLGLADAALIE